MAEDREEMKLDITPLQGIFSSIRQSLDTQTSVLQKLVDHQEKMVEIAKAQRRTEGLRDVTGSQSGTSIGKSFGGSLAQSTGAGMGKGLGLGLGMLGGLGSLGLALPAFFGGLMAGDAGLEWMSQFGSGFDFTSLKASIAGFSDVISVMDPKSMTALAALIAVSGFSGTRGAKGLGAMGLGISAFLGGLMAGNLVFTAVDALGGSLDFGALKTTMSGFSDAILSLNPDSMVILAGIMGLSGVGGTRAAKGVGSMGLAISAFLGGLLAGDQLFEGVNSLGVSLDFGALKTVLSGFSGAIASLTPEAAIALAGIIGGAGALATLGVGPAAAAKTAAIMTGIGAGISGLMIGLAAGDKAISWLNGKLPESGGLATAFKTFNDSVGELNNETSILAFASILAAGGAIGALTGGAGPTAAIGIASIMTGIGAGISGLFIGLAAGGKIVDLINMIPTGGDGFTSVMRMFNNSILAITPEAITRLTTMSNSKIGDGLVSLGAGMAAFFGAQGLGEVGNIYNTAKDMIQGAVNWIFGTDFGGGQKSAIEMIIDGLKPLDTLGNDMITKMDSFGSAITRFVDSFQSLNNIQVSGLSANITSMLTNVGGLLDAMPYLLNGGTWSGQRVGFGDNINFGDGLNSLSTENVDQIKNGLTELYSALDIETNTTARTAPGSASETQNSNLEAIMVATAAAAAQAAQAASSAAQSAALAASRAGGVVTNNVTTTNVTTDPFRSIDPALPGPQ